VNTRDLDVWFSTPGGRQFVAEAGGREAARARLSAAMQAEVKAARDFTDRWEETYGRRPAIDEVRFHPSVQVKVATPFHGTSRQWADSMKWTAPDWPVTLADEPLDRSSLLPR
jgi:hypothetical protein